MFLLSEVGKVFVVKGRLVTDSEMSFAIQIITLSSIEGKIERN